MVEPVEPGEHGDQPVVKPGKGSLALAHHLRLQAAREGGGGYIQSQIKYQSGANDANDILKWGKDDI